MRGITTGAGNSGMGVWGTHNGNGWGVFGESSSFVGVGGATASSNDFGAGVWGQHTSAGGTSAGVLGTTNSTAAFAHGVRGEVVAANTGNRRVSHRNRAARHRPHRRHARLQPARLGRLLLGNVTVTGTLTKRARAPSASTTRSSPRPSTCSTPSSRART